MTRHNSASRRLALLANWISGRGIAEARQLGRTRYGSRFRMIVPSTRRNLRMVTRLGASGAVDVNGRVGGAIDRVT